MPSRRKNKPAPAVESTEPLPVLYRAEWGDDVEDGVIRKKSKPVITEFKAIERTATEFVFDHSFHLIDKKTNRHRISEVNAALKSGGDWYGAFGTKEAALDKLLQNELWNLSRNEKDVERSKAKVALVRKLIGASKSKRK